MSKNHLAIIPARGGSKAIHKKNLAPLAQKPLIQYTIEAAKASKCFDIICVTTDDLEIIALAEALGIHSVQRPAELSQDNSMTIDAVLHVIKSLEDKGLLFDVATLLQPTSPFRTAKHIQEAIQSYTAADYNSLISFSEVTEHPYKSFTLSPTGKLKPLFGKSYLSSPRQQLPKVIIHNGAIYINKVNDLKEHLSFFIEPIYPYMMEREDSLDIDEKIDLEFAEFHLNQINAH